MVGNWVAQLTVLSGSEEPQGVILGQVTLRVQLDFQSQPVPVFPFFQSSATLSALHTERGYFLKNYLKCDIFFVLFFIYL